MTNENEERAITKCHAQQQFWLAVVGDEDEAQREAHILLELTQTTRISSMHPYSSVAASFFRSFVSRKRWKWRAVGQRSLELYLYLAAAVTVYIYTALTIVTQLDDPSNPHEIYIVAQGGGPGRLGNKMFQYASSLGVYRQRQLLNNNNDTVHFCVDPLNPFSTLQRIFVGPFPRCNFPGNRRPSIQQRPEHGYGMYQLFDTTCYWKEACFFSLGKYMQSFRYLQLADSEIRDTFRFQHSIQSQADRILEPVRLSHDNTTTTLVAVHVRRGDTDRADWLRMAPASYFDKAMLHFRQYLGKNVRFLVASDDKAWCREQEIFRRNDVVLLPTSMTLYDAVDLTVMAPCDHAIISVGTFGWWAAWLTRGRVIYFQNALILGARTNRGQVKLEDYYPPEWTGIS